MNGLITRYNFQFLRPADRPVIDELKDFEVVYAKDQPQYIPLRTLKSRTPEGQALSRWTLTDEQRQMIANGADIFLELSTFNSPLQPIRLAVSDGPNPDYFAIEYRLPPHETIADRIANQSGEKA